MKHKNLHAYLTAFLLSFVLGLGTVGCLCSGYGLRADATSLFFGCLVLSAIITAVLCSRHWAWISVGILFLLVGIVVLDHNFQQQLVSMIDVVCQVFAKAYGLTPPTFLLHSTYASHLVPLLTFHCIVCYTCAYVLIYRQSVFMTAIPSILFLALCFLTLDTLPDLSYILLWLFGFATVLITHPTRRQDTAQGIRLTRLVALPMVIFLLIGLVLAPPDGSTVPHITGFELDSLSDWFSGSGTDQHTGSVSLSGTVSLDELGPRRTSNEPIMTVTSSYNGDIYLRAQDFDVYTGTAWNASRDREESDYILPSRWSVINGTVQIQPAQRQEHLYIPCYPQTVFPTTGGAVRTSASKKDYTITSTRLQDDWVAQWRSGIRIPSVSVDARYLTLPEKTLNAALPFLAQISGLQQADTIEKANLIREFVRSSARYDQNTEAMPSNQRDFAIWFLQDSDTGYCVHYASAATVLLRAAGIPARYVEGFAIDSIRDRAFTVTDLQAHAWVEYYLDGAGWIVLDPTNVSSVDPTQTRPTTPPTTEPTTQPTTQTTTTRPSTTQPSTTQPSIQPTTVPTTAPPAQQESRPSNTSVHWWFWLFVSVAVIGLIFGLIFAQYLLRRSLKKRKLRRGEPNQQAAVRYKEANRLSALSGLPVPKALKALAEKATFSQHTLTEAELNAFDTFYADCRTAIGKMKLLQRFCLRFFRAAY